MDLLYMEKGKENNDTILFIHGEGLGKWMWNKQMDYFKKYHCIYIDLPYHGQNKLIKPFIMEETVDLIKKIIKNKGKKKVNIIGHSLGANVAVEIASTYPELICNIILTGYISKESKKIMKIHKKIKYKIVTNLLKKKFIAKSFCKKMGFDKDMEREFIEEYKRMEWKRLYSIFSEYIDNFGIPKQLLNSKIPALFLVGEFEEKLKKESVVDLMVAMPKSEGVIIKNSKNSYPWVIYDDYNNIVDKWIERKTIPENLIFLKKDD